MHQAPTTTVGIHRPVLDGFDSPGGPGINLWRSEVRGMGLTWRGIPRGTCTRNAFLIFAESVPNPQGRPRQVKHVHRTSDLHRSISDPSGLSNPSRTVCWISTVQTYRFGTRTCDWLSSRDAQPERHYCEYTSSNIILQKRSR